MNREFLKKLGLDDETVEKVMAEHGKSVNGTKQELETVTTERDNLQDTLKDRDKQLKKLKDIDPEKLQQEIADLEQANKAKDDEHAATVKDLQLTAAIKLALANNVHDVDVAATLVDKEKLVVGEDGAVIGLDEQLESLKENKAYLFKQEEKPGNSPQIFVPGNPKGGSNNVVTKEQIMKEPDANKRQKMIRENSHLFQ